MLKRGILLTFIIVCGLFTLCTSLICFAYFDKTTFQMGSRYFFMNDTADMESDYSDSIPKNSLVIAEKANVYDVGDIILYTNPEGKDFIGKITQRVQEGYNLVFKIGVVITDEYSEDVKTNNILGECLMYNLQFYSVIAFITSITGIVGVIVLPAFIFIALLLVYVADLKGHYGKTVKKSKTKKEISVVSQAENEEDFEVKIENEKPEEVEPPFELDITPDWESESENEVANVDEKIPSAQDFQNENSVVTEIENVEKIAETIENVEGEKITEEPLIISPNSENFINIENVTEPLKSELFIPLDIENDIENEPPPTTEIPKISQIISPNLESTARININIEEEEGEDLQTAQLTDNSWISGFTGETADTQNMRGPFIRVELENDIENILNGVEGAGGIGGSVTENTVRLNKNENTEDNNINESNDNENNTEDIGKNPPDFVDLLKKLEELGKGEE